MSSSNEQISNPEQSLPIEQLTRKRRTLAQLDFIQAHHSLRHLLTITMKWFTWFIVLNYGSMAWVGTHFDVAKTNRFAVSVVMAVFICNNILGILWLLRLSQHFKKQVNHIPGSYKHTSADISSFGLSLMSITLACTAIAWTSFIPLLFFSK